MTVLACCWFAALIPAATVVPSGTAESMSSAGVVTRSSTTLVGNERAWVLAVVAVPLALGIVVWIGLRRRCMGRFGWEHGLLWAPLSVLLLFALVSAASIGLLLLPGALALLAA
ncbi:MAG TPA: hypothetical protein VFL87_01185, partial [Thermoleophilaceae bacterium]|nr:hypothetical protein [Thermoleophilaceae bacterium]